LVNGKTVLFKLFIAIVGMSSPVPYRIICMDDEKEFFMLRITGLFIDPTTHSMVAEAYVLLLTPPLDQFYRTDTMMAQILDLPPVTSEEIKIWKMAMPAMVERCRDWEHNKTCEYQKEIPVIRNCEHWS
jgi:hypothetical protein